MKTGMSPRLLAVALGALLWCAAITPARAEVKNDKTGVTAPEAVMAAFHKAYPKAVVRGVAKETKDGKTYFEIESTDGAQRRDLLYMADGTVFEIEEAVAVGDLPKIITDTLATRFPKGELQKAERIVRGEVTHYEVLMENGEDQLEVLLDAKGGVISSTSVKDADDETETATESDDD